MELLEFADHAPANAPLAGPMEWAAELTALAHGLRQGRAAVPRTPGLHRVAHRSPLDGTIQPYTVHLPDGYRPDRPGGYPVPGTDTHATRSHSGRAVWDLSAPDRIRTCDLMLRRSARRVPDPATFAYLRHVRPSAPPGRAPGSAGFRRPWGHSLDTAPRLGRPRTAAPSLRRHQPWPPWPPKPPHPPAARLQKRRSGDRRSMPNNRKTATGRPPG
jgi:hypothetical protein